MSPPSFVHYQRGINLDNAGNTSEAIEEFTKAIEIDNHPLAYYCRACIYKDLRKYKEAIKDFQSYLKYGSKSTPEGISSRVSIDELKSKLKTSSRIKGKRSEIVCPVCKCNLVVIAKDVELFGVPKKLKCPECGRRWVKI